MLSKTAEYALRAVTFLARGENEVFSAEVIAERTKVPRRYVHKVLQDLVTGGVLISRPGPRGGYGLDVSAKVLTILDVVNAVAPIERIRHCPLGLVSHTSLCPLHKELDQAFEATEAAFRSVTIQALLESTNPIVPLCEVTER
jgi:Rrf2 family transcriptional regulator, nitric oxide-sensitive transcriptional repressor